MNRTPRGNNSNWTGVLFYYTSKGKLIVEILTLK